MEVILAFAIMPVLGLIGASLMFAGGDVRRTAGSTRLLTIAGRVVTGLLIVGCLWMLWSFRESPKDLYILARVVGFLTIASAFVVFRRAPPLVRTGLTAAGGLLYVGSFILMAFDEGGWHEVFQQVKWPAIVMVGWLAIGAVVTLFAKRPPRDGSDHLSGAETTGS